MASVNLQGKGMLFQGDRKENAEQGRRSLWFVEEPRKQNHLRCVQRRDDVGCASADRSSHA